MRCGAEVDSAANLPWIILDTAITAIRRPRYQFLPFLDSQYYWYGPYWPGRDQGASPWFWYTSITDKILKKGLAVLEPQQNNVFNCWWVMLTNSTKVSNLKWVCPICWSWLLDMHLSCHNKKIYYSRRTEHWSGAGCPINSVTAGCGIVPNYTKL